MVVVIVVVVVVVVLVAVGRLRLGGDPQLTVVRGLSVLNLIKFQYKQF